MTCDIGTVKQFFATLRGQRIITAGEEKGAVKRFCKYGHAYIIRNRVQYTWSPEAFGCECGLGVGCGWVRRRMLKGATV